MSRKMFFTKELCNKIVEDLIPEENQNTKFLVSVQFSDIRTILAKFDEALPEFFESIFPAVIIQPDNIEIVNACSNKSIQAQVYSFRIQYLHYRKQENGLIYDHDTELLQAIENCECIATALHNDDNLQGVPIGQNPFFQLTDEDGALQAHILETVITDLQYNRLGTAILNDMISGLSNSNDTREKLHMCEFGYEVTIRTVYNKRRS